MLLDEPIAGVDATTQHAIFTLLEGLKQKGTTIIATTHDLSCVAEWFDRVWPSTIASLPSVRPPKSSLGERSRPPMAATCSSALQRRRNDVDLLISPLQNDFMVRALIAALLIGLVCSIVGVYVVLRNMSFIGDGLAHASFAGIVIAYLLKFDLYIGGLIFTILTALGIGAVSKKSEVSLDTTIGVFFTAAFALGIALMSHVKNYVIDLQDFLFGNILAIDRKDIVIIALLTTVILAVIALLYKELLFASFDPVSAGASGLPVDGLSYLLLGILAVTIIVSLQAAGIVLVAALLVTPAATAYQLTNRFGPMMFISAIVGMGSAIVGLYLSFYLNVASGASIVLVATACFFGAMIFSPKRRSLLTALLDARRTAARVK